VTKENRRNGTLWEEIDVISSEIGNLEIRALRWYGRMERMITAEWAAQTTTSKTKGNKSYI
jgi:hypothetical protein